MNGRLRKIHRRERNSERNLKNICGFNIRKILSAELRDKIHIELVMKALTSSRSQFSIQIKSTRYAHKLKELLCLHHRWSLEGKPTGRKIFL